MNKSVMFVFVVCLASMPSKASWFGGSKAASPTLTDAQYQDFMRRNNYGSFVGGSATEQVFLTVLEDIKYYGGRVGIPAAMLLGSFWVVSKMRKENPEFVAQMSRAATAPFGWMRSQLEQRLYGAERLSWNDLMITYNRLMGMVNELAKNATAFDLQKRRDLKDVEGESAAWMELCKLLQDELGFAAEQLAKKKQYYASTSFSSSLTVASVDRNRQIVEYIGFVVRYMEAIKAHLAKVENLADLNKDQAKKLIDQFGGAMEVLASHVDPTAAVSRDGYGYLQIGKKPGALAGAAKIGRASC